MTRRSRRAIWIFLTSTLVLGGTIPGQAYYRPGSNLLTSLDSKERQPAVSGCSNALRINCDGDSRFPAISPTGRFVVFTSYSDTLVEGDTNQVSDIFLRDRQRGKTQLVSVATDGSQAVGLNVNPDDPQNLDIFTVSHSGGITPNGRYVVFTSNAPNLDGSDAALDVDVYADVFVHDRRSGVTTLISATPAGGVADSRSGAIKPPSISDSGRYVVFDSDATNLVPDDTNGTSDVFLHDRKTGKTRIVSVGSSGMRNQKHSWCGEISGNGRFVLFSTQAQLVPEDTNGTDDVYLHDLKTDETLVVSIPEGLGPTRGGGFSGRCQDNHYPGRSISANGRYVLYSGQGMNGHVPTDSTTLDIDFFVRDMSSGRIQRVTVNSFGEEVPGRNFYASISADGRYVTFASFAKFDSRTANPTTNVFLHDLRSGVTELISVDVDLSGNIHCSDPTSAGTSESPTVSDGGTFVAFSSCAKNMVPGQEPFTGDVDDDNSSQELVFVRDRGRGLGTSFDAVKPGDPDPPPDDRICIGDICIPPGGVRSIEDTPRGHKESSLDGSNLRGIRIANRPELGDLFIALDLEHMPAPTLALEGLSVPGLVYGLRFEAQGVRYETRATLLAGQPSFGLFRCYGQKFCSKVTDLRGGYGTTGHSVVFSLPMSEIGRAGSGRLSNVEAYSGLGSTLIGVIHGLDTLRWEWP